VGKGRQGDRCPLLIDECTHNLEFRRLVYRIVRRLYRSNQAPRSEEMGLLPLRHVPLIEVGRIAVTVGADDEVAFVELPCPPQGIFDVIVCSDLMDPGHHHIPGLRFPAI